MNTGTIKLRGLLAATALLAAAAHADNACIDSYVTNSWFCLQAGTLSAGYGLAPATINVGVGQTIVTPAVTGLSITNGWEGAVATVTLDCVVSTYAVSNTISYAIGAPYFVPALPALLWNPGTYYYTGMVTATGSPCGPLTNTVGIVTVTVATNNPDVLLDVDFGGHTNSTKTGYAAIGDSAGDFWNGYAKTNLNSGALASLKTAEGVVSPVGLLVTNLPTLHTNASSDAMYDDYLGTNAATATVTVTNLPAGTWNVFLYASDGNFSLSAGGVNYGTNSCHDTPSATPPAWQPGVQYVLFPNVVVTNGQPLTVTINPGTNGTAMLAGLQIASLNHTPAALPSAPAGIAAWWRAENNALDSIGTNNGTLMNSAGYASGEVGQGFNLNQATSDYIQAAPGPLWTFGTNDFTIELWANFRTYAPSGVWYYPEDTFIACDEGGGDVNKWLFSMFNGNLTFLIDSPSYSYHFLVNAPFVPATNQWYHLAVVRSGDSYTIYTNGVVIGTDSYHASIPQPNAPLTMGQSEGLGYMNGRLDEVSLYQRALAASEIQAIYLAGSNGKIASPMQDSDYDGVSDLQELADRTNPNDPNSVLNLRLGYWSFDTTNWIGSAGQLPLVATTNLVSVPSWSTNAVLIDSTNPAILTYRDVETNGNANINLRSGSVQFWFRPDWSSGTGPGTAGRLIEMGNQTATNGWWALAFNTNGTQLTFGTQTNGLAMTNLTAAVEWASNVWHQVVLTYTPTNSWLYFNGQAVTNGAGSIYFPNAAERATGFIIGGDATSNNHAKGAFDELYTFNYPLSSGVILSNYLALAPVILAQPTNQTVIAGTNVAFYVDAVGFSPLTYQWYFNSAAVGNATNATLTLSNVQTNNSGSYFVVITNSIGSVTSSVAALAVVLPPTVLITNPPNNTVYVASMTNLTLTATASDVAGTISQVQFFQGTNSLGIITNSPYSLVWSNAPAGVYTLTAVAADDGLAATSPPVVITISPLFDTNTMRLWLKADVITGLTNNAPVGTWTDSSGWGNNATQTTSGAQPLCVTNTLNGLPVVRFNGTSSYFNLPPTLMDGVVGAEAFVVLKAATNTPAANSSLWQIGYATGGGGLNGNGYPAKDGSLVDDFGSTAFKFEGFSAQPLTQYHLYEVTSQSNNFSAWVNGSLLYQTATNTVAFASPTNIFAGSPTSGGFSLGYFFYAIPFGGSYSGYFYGDVAEVLIFSRGLTASERLTVSSYLNGKYGLVPAVPPTPTNLVAQAIATNQIALTWSETLTNGGATQIAIERSLTSNGVFTVVAQIPAGTSYVDTNLAAGTTYFYQVQAVNLTQLSPASNIAQATTTINGAGLPFNALALWLKADTGLMQGGTNTPVNLWADQSGNGNHAIQTSEANQPLWVPGALGGRPVVRFNGTSSYFNLPPTLMNGAAGAEAFVVLKAATNAPAANSSLWQIGSAPAFGSTLGNSYPEMNGSIADDFASSAMQYEGVPAQSLTQYHLYEVTSQHNNFAAWVNGSLLFQTVTNTVGFATGTVMDGVSEGPSLGEFYYHIPYDSNYGGVFYGDIAEVLIFSRGLTASERDTVGNYLLSKYALSQYATNTSLPSAPTNLTATGMAPYQLNLQWTSTATNNYSFHVERKTGTTGVFQEIGVVPSYAPSFVDTTASPATTNYYRVKAHNLFGDSGYSTNISPPTVSLTNWPATIIARATNMISAQSASVNGSVTNLDFFANRGSFAAAATAPYTVNWPAPMEGTLALSALAQDNLGNSQFSAPVSVMVYLDSNGDGIPDITQVSAGNDPLNPWVPPALNTNDHSAPIIILLIPTNAVVVP